MTAVLTSLATTFFRNAAVHPGSYCVSELTSFFTPWLRGGDPSLVMLRERFLLITPLVPGFTRSLLRLVWVEVPINCLLNHGHDVAGLNVGI